MEDVCDWSELHEDYLTLMMSKMSIPDRIRAGGVCTSWQLALASNFGTKVHISPQLPLLMFPSSLRTTKDEDASTARKEENFSFYCPAGRQVYNDLKISLPKNKRCCGSSHGWLLVIGAEDTGFSVELIHPFLPADDAYHNINLPPLTAFELDPTGPDYGYDYIRRVILTANPVIDPTGYVVLAIYGPVRVAYWKPGDKVWNILPWRHVWDVTYHEGVFYATSQTKVISFTLTGSESKTLAMAPVCFLGDGTYILKSSGDLLVVHRRRTDYMESSSIVSKFLVLKLVEVNDDDFWLSKWVEVKSLDDRVLFLGENASMSLSASDFPGCKPNCIYFTDDYSEGYNYTKEMLPHDIGVFNLEDCSYEQLYPVGYVWPPPVWVEPTLRQFNLLGK